VPGRSLRILALVAPLVAAAAGLLGAGIALRHHWYPR
jgi:hypothetical protein